MSIIVTELDSVLKPIFNAYEALDGLIQSTHISSVTPTYDLWTTETSLVKSNLNQQLLQLNITNTHIEELKNSLLSSLTSEAAITPYELTNKLKNVLEGKTGVSEDLDEMLTSILTLTSETSQTITTPYELKNKLKDILEGKTGVLKDLDEMLTTNTAQHMYEKVSSSSRINQFAQDVVGFKSEEEFQKFIDEDAVKDPDSPAVRKVFKKLYNWAKNNKSIIAKSILAVGMGAPFVAMIQKLQRENTGCFVYYTDEKTNELKRHKILNRSCAFDQYLLASSSDSNNNFYSHPLDGISWDCSYDTHILKMYDKWKILEAGCNAICEPHNYNLLASHISGYFPLNNDESYLSNKNKYWKCENSTFLRALTIEMGSTVRDVAGGLMQGLNLNLSELRTLALYVFIFILSVTALWFFGKIIMNYYNNNTKRR